MVKLGLAVLFLLRALEVSATPTMYAFTGTVTSYSAYGATDSSKIGGHVSGTFVYTGNPSSFMDISGSQYNQIIGISSGGCDFARLNVCSMHSGAYNPIVSAFSFSTSWGDSYAAQANYSIGSDYSTIGYARVFPFQNISPGWDSVGIRSLLSVTNYFSPDDPGVYTFEQASLELIAMGLGNLLLGNMLDFPQLPDFSSMDPSLSSVNLGYNRQTCNGANCGNPINLWLGASLDSLSIVQDIPPQPVPEPSSFALMGLGVLALWSASRLSLRRHVSRKSSFEIDL